MIKLDKLMRISAHISLIFLAVSLAACGGTRRSSTALNPDDFVWPLPPEQPRIQFVKSVHSEMDVGRQKSFAQKVSESVFGRSRLFALKKPLTTHVDDRGRLYVVDTGYGKVIIFDFANHKVDVLGKSGRGRLRNPLGVTTDAAGRIYVSDAGGLRIMVYDAEGSFLTAYGGKNLLVRPTGIAVNSALGRVYVVDTWAHQVKIFDRDTGKLQFSIGKHGQQGESPKLAEGVTDQVWNRGDGEGEFRFPTYLTIDGQGNVYIVDTLNFRVQVFDPDGQFLRAFGEVGNLPGNLYRPKGIGLDSEGHIYVADAAFNNIQIFDQQGKLLLNFGTFGSGLADLRLPAGLYISQRDEIYVVDQFNHRVQVYQYLGNEPKSETESITEKGRR